MKKLLAMLLALVMVLSFAACGTTEEPVEEPTDAPVEEPTEEPTEEPAEATYTLGLGTVVKQSVGEKAQVDATFAAVVLDAEGTIVAVDLDVAQSKGVKDDAGVYTAEGFDARTKTEKGPDYGMTVASPIARSEDAQVGNEGGRGSRTRGDSYDEIGLQHGSCFPDRCRMGCSDGCFRSMGYRQNR